MHGMIDGFPRADQVVVLGYLRSGAMTAPGLGIKAAGSADALAAAFSYAINGKLGSKAAQATLSLAGLGTVAAGATKTAFLTITTNGTVSVVGVTADGDGETEIPEPDDGACLWGAVTVANASTSEFVAGTTALDATNITVTYASLFGAVPGDTL